LNNHDTTPPTSPGDGETKPIGTPRLEKLGDFPIEEKIGEGGMGVVYRARDPRLHRVVAIKRIHPNLQGSAPAAERFIREARAIAAVSHPNIAQIFSIHDSDGEEQGFFVMEFVAGPSVEARASAEGGLEVAEAISIIAQASRGLAAALKRGIIHRDMKPSNLLLTPQGDVKIVDFGLASQAANVEVDEEEILCTPQFGSPEQVRGWAIDHRSDIYSLGATLFYLLIGREPFPRENRVEVFVAHANEPPPRPGSLRQGIPERLDQVVLKMLAKRPQDRYEDYEALLTDLEEIHRELTGTSTKLSRGRRLLPTISVGLLLLFVAAGLGRELLGKGSTSVIPIEQRLRGIISQAPPYERLSYTFSDRSEQSRLERHFRFPGLAQEAGTHPGIAPAIRRGLLLWSNDSRPVPFPFLSNFRELDIRGLRFIGRPDFELLLGYDQDHPGNFLRLRFGVGTSHLDLIDCLRNGEQVPVTIEGSSPPLVIEPGIRHHLRISLLDSDDPQTALFKVRIEKEETEGTIEPLALIVFSIPAKAVPRGAVAIRCEGDFSPWNISIEEVEIIGLLDRDRIARKWLIEGG